MGNIHKCTDGRFSRDPEKLGQRMEAGGQKVYKTNNICSIVMILVNYLDNIITIIIQKFQTLVTVLVKSYYTFLVKNLVLR